MFDSRRLKDRFEIKEKIGQVIEGYENLLTIKALKDKSYVDENLLNMLMRLIEKNHVPEDIRMMLIKYLRTSDIKAVIFDWFNTLARYEPPREISPEFDFLERLSVDDFYP